MEPPIRRWFGMNIRNIKYVSVFSIILLFTIYQFLLSFNVIPYFLSGQDIYALLFLLLSLVLLFISIRIEDVSAKVSTIVPPSGQYSHY